ncbi:copper transport protein ATX1-like [Vicia villosa]|uniref:copper transport protein ATX1-like n=1 Tax=Vicia villosa TaxID=3911 RepID=UPI00273C3AD0|nr:copper transport protein ATX1-like [Vicia villosa]
MSCSGCSGAVNRVLEKMEGVESFEIDMKEQNVTVKGNVKPQDVFDTVSKTGKKTEFWVEPGNKPVETATEVEPDSKLSEATAIVSVEPDNKPSENITAVSTELENKSFETATIAA